MCGSFSIVFINKILITMNLLYIIRETLLMMGFTFVVGIVFAYVLKLMTLFFSNLSRENLPALVARGKGYCLKVAHTYNCIRTFTWEEYVAKQLPDSDSKEDTALYSMTRLAEYHFGSLRELPKQGMEMNQLYEMHHGKI